MDANTQVFNDESPTEISSTKRARVIAKEPDRSFSRYIIDEFKTKAIGSKEVPFESIDVNLYKPKAKLLGFRTSEDRLHLWIEAIATRYVNSVMAKDKITVTWEEIESLSHPGKPDKVVLSVKKEDEKLFVISVFVTTGRIQVQGAYYIQWSSTEFPVLMRMVKKISESENSSPDLATESQECLFQEHLSVSGDEEKDTDSEDEDVYFNKQPDKIPETESNNLSVKLLAETITNIEHDFIKSKANLEDELYKIKKSLDDVSFVKDKLIQFENQIKANISGFDDRLYHNESATNKIDNKLTEMTSKVKNLQDQNKQLLSKQTKMQTEMDTLKKVNDGLKKELFLVKEIVQKHENALDNHENHEIPASQQETDPLTPPHVEQGNHSTTKTSAQPQLITQSQSILLVIDSNGKFVKPTLLCPDEHIDIKTSYTLKHATDNINGTLHNPKTIIIHCGTNDLERSKPENVIKETQSLLETTQKKFSKAKIIYSSLLPRQDPVQHNVTKVNEAMEQYCKRCNIQYLNNTHIFKPYQFYDFKHLNQRGFKFFAKNLKSAIYGTATRQQRSDLSPRNNSNSFPSPLSPEFWPKRSLTPIPPAPIPTYASVTASPGNYPSRPIHPIPNSLLNPAQSTYASAASHENYSRSSRPIRPRPNSLPAQPMNTGIINPSGLPIPLKSLIQQLQMFI